MPELAIIIVSYNTRSLLRECLSHLMPRLSALAARVVVVDNASSDGSAQMVRNEFPEVQVIANPHNAGFAAASNQAIRATDSRYVLLLNSDAFPHGKAIEELRRAMDDDDRIAVAGPRMQGADGVPLASAHRVETLGRLAAASLGIHQLLPVRVSRWAARVLGKAGAQHLLNYEAATPVDVDWVSGACMMVRRSAAADVGLMDERYFMYMEDEDWCRRLRQAGFRVVYVPGAKVTHCVGSSAASSTNSARIYRHSRLIYHKQHHPRLYPLFWLLANLYAARQCGLAALTGMFDRSHSEVHGALSQRG